MTERNLNGIQTEAEPDPNGTETLESPELKPKTRKRFIAGIATIIIAAAVWFLVPGVREWIGDAAAAIGRGDTEFLAEYLRGFGPWAAVVSFILMMLQSVAAPLPAFVITFTNAYVFGWLWGALLSWSSAMAGAALCFWLARSLGRAAIEKLAGGKTSLEVTDLFFKRYGDRAVFIARLLPFVSFDAVSYAAGLTSMGFWRFFLATGLGQLPATLVYSYFGGQLTGGVKILLWVFLATTALFVLFATLRPWYLRRLEAKAASEPADETSDS